MAFDRFMIGPTGGQQTLVKPWLIPDEAFAQLNNCYVFRGRLRKRFGSYLMNGNVDNEIAQLYSRLRINVATTAAVTGNLTSTIMPGSVWAIGQQFSVGDTIFTVKVANGATLTTGAATATYNTANGALVITGNNENPSTAVYFYPGTPVMGLISYETNVINDEPVYAFDTQFSYKYTGGITGAWTRLGTMTWTGNDSEFFWGWTYRGITSAQQFLFVTNYNAPDRTAYWDGFAWNVLAPIINPTSRIYTARIIIPFKNLLLMLNTVEADEGIQVGISNTDSSGNLSSTAVTGATLAHPFAVGQNFTVGSTIFTILVAAMGTNALATSTNGQNPSSTATLNITNAGLTTANLTITGNGLNPSTPVYYMPNTSGSTLNYFNRCRFSWDGSPVDVTAWQENVVGHGGYTDADTSEQIITCQFIKDRLIVYFERSTWELVYTGNNILPIIWQKINTELGSESTFSVIPFDRVAIGIANVGVHACNGSNVERIDLSIPDEVFGISNDNNGVYRVYGIRDYYTEMIYWTFPSIGPNDVYPNRVLTFNYRTKTWAFNDDSITCFGYYQDQSTTTWSSIQGQWFQAGYSWNSATIQAKFRDIIAGNQQGFVFICSADEYRNSPSLQITDVLNLVGQQIITCINHNLNNNDYIALENLQGVTGIDYPNNIFQVQRITSDSIAIYSENYAGNYLGGGTLARVSQIDILTKQYNFYVEDGRNAYVQKVDMLVDRTYQGEITVDTYVSSTEESQIQNAQATGSIMGTGILETSPYALVPLEQVQDRLWHPIYPQAEGECVQLHIYFSPEQIMNANISFEDFQLHAMTFYTQPTSSRLQ